LIWLNVDFIGFYLSKYSGHTSLLKASVFSLFFNHTGIVTYCQVALGYVMKYGVKFVRVLTLEKNRGKGGAVRMVCQPLVCSLGH